MTFQEPDGATPLDPDERQGLKYDHITTRGELDELEQANIEQGLAWAAKRRSRDVFDDGFIRRLHKELFGDVWTWAGTYRQTEKNIGIDPLQIPEQLRMLLDKANHGRYGCATVRNKGTCTNTLKIHQDKLEQMVLNVLQTHLMNEELCKEFCDEYARRMNELRAAKVAQINGHKAELSRLDGAKRRIVQAVIDGFANQTLKLELDQVEARYAELERLIENTDVPPVILHPSMAVRYRTEVTALVETINKPERSEEAIGTVRSLIEKIVLTPNEAGSDLVIDLHGALAGILTIAMNREKPMADNDDLISVVKLVAEEGLEPPTRGL